MSIAEKFATMEYGPAPEDPKEAVAWLERHGRRFGFFIDGGWKAPVAGEYFDTLDPSTGEKLASVAQGGQCGYRRRRSCSAQSVIDMARANLP